MLSHKREIDDPVWQIVMERARAGSRSGARSDGFRVALAFEGGGMAGSVSAGMGAALESLGLLPSFDSIYGSSSGSFNASYTAAGQAQLRASLYVVAARAGLIRPHRLVRGRPPFRLAEIIRSVLAAHPHHARVLNDAPRLRITAARVDDKRLDVLGDFVSLEELRTAVWASSAIPVLAGDIVDFRGRRYVDGGLVESIPYRVALIEGATHVLVLRSRHPGYRKRNVTRSQRRLIDRLLLSAPDTIAEMVFERPDRYNDEALELERGELAGRVTQVAPVATARGVSQIESRPQRIVAGIGLGLQSVYGVFGVPWRTAIGSALPQSREIRRGAPDADLGGHPDGTPLERVAGAVVPEAVGSS